MKRHLIILLAIFMLFIASCDGRGIGENSSQPLQDESIPLEVTYIAFESNSDLLIAVGETDGRRANTRPPGGTIIYESEDPDIATVDAEGNVTGLKDGGTTITATCNGLSASYNLYVGNYPVHESRDVGPIFRQFT